jgi:hypothetical protein
MNIADLKPFVVAAALAVSSLAGAAPGERGLVTKFKTRSVSVLATAEVNGVLYSLTAQNYDDLDGTPQATISVDRFDSSTLSSSFVVCSGARFANTVTVNKTSGAATVIAVLDPTAADCYGANSTTLTVNLVGVPTGTFSVSETSESITRSGELVMRALSDSDAFDENYVGTMGYYTGAMTGRAQTVKVRQRTRVY